MADMSNRTKPEVAGKVLKMPSRPELMSAREESTGPMPAGMEEIRKLVLAKRQERGLDPNA